MISRCLAAAIVRRPARPNLEGGTRSPGLEQPILAPPVPTHPLILPAQAPRAADLAGRRKPKPPAASYSETWRARAVAPPECYRCPQTNSLPISLTVHSPIENPRHQSEDRAQRSKEPRVLPIRFAERRVAPFATLQRHVVLNISKRRLTIGRWREAFEKPSGRAETYALNTCPTLLAIVKPDRIQPGMHELMDDRTGDRGGGRVRAAEVVRGDNADPDGLSPLRPITVEANNRYSARQSAKTIKVRGRECLDQLKRRRDLNPDPIFAAQDTDQQRHTTAVLPTFRPGDEPIVPVGGRREGIR